MKKSLSLFFILITASLFAKEYNIANYTTTDAAKANTTVAIEKIFTEIKSTRDSAPTIVFPRGNYNFSRIESFMRTYYISNHDQTQPKEVGIPIDNIDNLTINGNGSNFIFHGRMLPISVVESKNVTLRNFEVDFADPKIMQLTRLDVEGKNYFQIAKGTKYKVELGRLILEGENYKIYPNHCLVFDGKTNQIWKETSDYLPTGFMFSGREVEPYVVEINDPRLTKFPAGTKFACRSGDRPTPGIFISLSKNIALDNVSVHHSEGMALLVQLTDSIKLNKFNVNIAKNSDRVFTSQADATHFSACRGVIDSQNGLYEGMMDDAINVHGTYLKIVQVKRPNTVVGQYIHGQSYGFLWGEVGDEVQFIKPSTMEVVDSKNRIASIKCVGGGDINSGVKKFEITFEKPFSSCVKLATGIENLTWTPKVIFNYNTVRNNRARGALFSTPQKTVCNYNTFDSVSGTGILLCGDCNGWYETGACCDVEIKGNTFINNLTSMFQFTSAIISIYPEIPTLSFQKKYFHSGIKISDNKFITFDRPILYAKSVDGLTFENNTIVKSNDFKPFHPNKFTYKLDRCKNVKIANNKFEGGYSYDKNSDLKLSQCDKKSISIE